MVEPLIFTVAYGPLCSDTTMQNQRNQRNRRIRKPKLKKGSRRNNAMAYIRGSLPFSTFVTIWPPTKIYAALHWDIIGSATTTTTVGELVFGANNPNDPGLTLSATQPVWYDQLQAFYNRYRVWDSRIEVNFNNNNSIPYEVVVFPTRSSTGVTTFADSAAQPYAKVRQGGSGSGNDRVRLVSTMNSSKMFGTPIELSTDYSGTANASPSLSWYWVVAHIGFDSTTSTILAYNIRVTQYIEFYDRSSVDESTLRLKTAVDKHLKRMVIVDDSASIHSNNEDNRH